MNEIADLVQAKKDAIERADAGKPALYNVVVRADTNDSTNRLAVHVIAHVVESHAGLNQVAAQLAATKALRYGREVIKVGVTKEIADTVVRSCNRCSARKMYSAFEFFSEPL